jgi:hypothetical protein
MMVPLSSLVALVVDCEVFIRDLRQKWLNSFSDNYDADEVAKFCRRRNQDQMPDFLAQATAALGDAGEGPSKSMSGKVKTAQQELECGGKRKSNSDGRDPRLHSKSQKRSSGGKELSTMMAAAAAAASSPSKTYHRSSGNGGQKNSSRDGNHHHSK